MLPPRHTSIARLLSVVIPKRGVGFLVLALFTVMRCVSSHISLVAATVSATDEEQGPGRSSYYLSYAHNPPQTIIRDATGQWLATFTRGTYTVQLHGPVRRFQERTASAAVQHTTWVRTLPTPFDGHMDPTWLDIALQANTTRVPDVLAIAMQYLEDAPPRYEGELQIAGDAAYGPLQPDGTRQEGADFNDYLGVPWVYADGTVDRPERRQFDSLDCSGFMRMVWGYRHHLEGFGLADTIPLTLAPTDDHYALPRRAYQLYSAAPGRVIIPDAGIQVIDLTALAIGDLVFFDADENDGTQLDHVGMYLGVDEAGHGRFISSRKAINGPTFGDYHGASILDGTGHYAVAFRAARRL